jgi:Lrp/AsnC family leucine-responsive transcriptional regulator
MARHHAMPAGARGFFLPAGTRSIFLSMASVPRKVSQTPPETESVASPLALDRIDRNILKHLQRNNRIANRDLARAVGLSPPACLKRVRRLRQAGAILADTAEVDPRALGYGVTVLARLSLERPSEEATERFERKVRAMPQVLQCWKVAGDTDFVLLVCARDLDDYQRFARAVLASDTNLRDYRSDIVLGAVKRRAPVPVD